MVPLATSTVATKAGLAPSAVSTATNSDCGAGWVRSKTTTPASTAAAAPTSAVVICQRRTERRRTTTLPAAGICRAEASIAAGCGRKAGPAVRPAAAHRRAAAGAAPRRRPRGGSRSRRQGAPPPPGARRRRACRAHIRRRGPRFRRRSATEAFLQCDQAAPEQASSRSPTGRSNRLGELLPAPAVAIGEQHHAAPVGVELVEASGEALPADDLRRLSAGSASRSASSASISSPAAEMRSAPRRTTSMAAWRAMVVIHAIGEATLASKSPARRQS